jgi:hypothetical protein
MAMEKSHYSRDVSDPGRAVSFGSELLALLDQMMKVRTLEVQVVE